tara:strand:- start:1460 stop:2479 length:1020 start_codon:yes stop_codon:yes gene_type:complete
MRKNIFKLYTYLMRRGLYAEAYSALTLSKLAATDPVATNKTERDSIEGNYFDESDKDLANYREKIWKLYFDDIYRVHFEKDKRKLIKEDRNLPEDQRRSEETIDELALENVKKRTSKAADKAIKSHSEFLSHLMTLEPSPEGIIVAPGSGFAHEQVISPDLNWSGLEYQKNLVDMANQRNKQMGVPSRSKQWSLLKEETPGSPVGEDWQGKVNKLRSDDGRVEAVYAKHACGGITDGAMFDAVNNDVPKIFLATCCAHRYTELSWRVLSPKDDSGRQLSYDEYEEIAKRSKRQDYLGEEAVEMIDDWREKYLEDNGYSVERGITSFGPFIKAKKLKTNS